MRPQGTVVFLALCMCVLSWYTAHADPVTTFIVRADSVASSGGETALAAFITENEALAGAAVGQLLDVAIEVGDQGEAEAEAENIAFAERVARVYESATGSDALIRLTEVYRSWTAVERQTRARGKSLEQEAAEARSAGDLAGADQRLRDALVLYGEIGDTRSQAVIWGSLGVVYFYAAEWDSVKAHYDRALTARRAIEDRILEGRTLNGLGSVHLQTGELATAVDYYRAAIALRERTGDISGLATSHTYLGHTYSTMGRVVDSRAEYEAALPLVQAAGQPWQMVDLLTSIGNLYRQTGQYGRAETAYVKASEIAMEAGDSRKEAACRVNLAVNLRFQGRYGAAISQFEAAEALIQDPPDPERAYLIRLERGETYRWIGEIERARDDVLASLEHAQALGNPVYDVDALIILSLVYRDLGAFDRAIETLSRAQALSEEAGLPEMTRKARDFAARIEIDRGKPERAIPHIEANISYDRERDAEYALVDDQLLLATAEASLGMMAEARERLRASLSSASRSGVYNAHVAYLVMGHTFERDAPDSAMAYYEKAMSMIESARVQLGGAEVQTGFLSGDRRRFYEEVARFYARQALAGDAVWSDRAFRTIERAKARGLLDLLEKTVVTAGSDAESAVLDSLYRLEAEGATAQAEKARLERRYVELRDARVRAAVGSTSETVIPSLQDLKGALSKKTALLAYALGDTASYLWVVDRRGAALYEIAPRAELRTAVERLRDAIRTPGSGDATFRGLARSLYQELVAPAATRLEKAETLVIIPDGILFEVPFETLLTADVADEVAFTDLPYMSRRYVTLYAPSAAVFLRLEASQKRKYEREVLALGDPDFSSLDTRPGSSALAPLHYTRSEVTSIASHVDDDRCVTLFGAEASEAALKTHLESGAPRVLHFATHGLVDPVEPIESSVALARSPESTEDGYLHTLEILSLRADARLVVLSACETGRGKLSRGEGVVGLSRAFIAGGANTVVVSLWAVSDESTAKLMDLFYRELFEKKRPAGQALSEARATLIRDSKYTQPFYWAPFIVIGTEHAPW